MDKMPVYRTRHHLWNYHRRLWDCDHLGPKLPAVHRPKVPEASRPPDHFSLPILGSRPTLKMRSLLLVSGAWCMVVVGSLGGAAPTWQVKTSKIFKTIPNDLIVFAEAYDLDILMLFDQLNILKLWSLPCTSPDRARRVLYDKAPQRIQ